MLLSAALFLSALSAQEPVDEELREPVSQERIDLAIHRGVHYLLSVQQPDGAWRYQGKESRAGCSALVLYALLKSGVDRDHDSIRKGIGRMQADPVRGTYDAACMLLALAEHGPIEHRDWIAELAEELVEWQNKDGDWGYPNGADLSNTQYAALGLRAAALSGADVPPRVWVRLADSMKSYESARGSFGYRRGSGGSSHSMTAAGVGTLAICDAMLVGTGALESDLAEDIQEMRDDGVEWITKRFEACITTDGGNSYYRIYGMERVGSLLGRSHFGPHDWYAEGAARLVETQDERGRWGEPRQLQPSPHLELVEDDGSLLPPTAFALLFLRRATEGKPGSGKRYAAGDVPRFGTTDSDAALQVRATGRSPLTMWITGFGRDAIERFEWPGENGRGPRVARVEYLWGSHVLAEALGDPSVPMDTERFAVQHTFSMPGRYRLHARAHVVVPPADGAPIRPGRGPLSTIDSPEFVVVVDEVVPDWVEQQADDRALNLMPDMGARVQASSTLEDLERLPQVSYEPKNAVDNRLRTPWLADPEDEQPNLRILLRNPKKIDVVQISNAMSVPYRSGYFARALEVDVTINGNVRHTIRMHPDERHKGRLELPRPISVRKLELEIRWSAAGEHHPALGLAEVELFLR